jgi:hypothetical protein
LILKNQNQYLFTTTKMSEPLTQEQLFEIEFNLELDLTDLDLEELFEFEVDEDGMIVSP